MAFTANKIQSDPLVTHQIILCRSHEKLSTSTRNNRVLFSRNGKEQGQLNHRYLLVERSTLSNEGIWCLHGKPFSFISRKSSFLCKSSGANNTEEKECDITYDDVADITSSHTKAKKGYHIPSGQGLAGACRFVYEDAKFVDQRALGDIFLLCRGIMRMEAHARQDVAFLGTEFLKLDGGWDLTAAPSSTSLRDNGNARAKEDTRRIDRKVKEKAKQLHHIATTLKDKAESRLKSAADEHWSDGVLRADLHLADFHAKQRAMEDALMALEFVKDIHDMMVSNIYKFPLQRNEGSLSANNVRGCITLQKNGKAVDFFPKDVSTDQIMAIQEAYSSMASAFSEADRIDCTDPEELELLITTLMDLDGMDGKQSVSLLAECSSSPNVSTRQALANALAKAPSMWTLGNAGMGALQRLAEDSSPAVAAAASKGIYELKKQWEMQEGHSWMFMMDENAIVEKESSKESDNEEDTY